MSKHLQRAAQNREELLNAAAEMMKTHGIHVPLQIIIDDAGVGRATFYRNFADRKHLIYALLEQSIDHLETRAKYYGQFEDGLFLLLHSHIKNLRRKLEAAIPEKEVIRSIYGVGYKFDPTGIDN